MIHPESSKNNRPKAPIKPPLLTSQSYRSLSCSMIHSSSISLFRSSFLSYFTVTFPCFLWTGSSRGMGPEPAHPTPAGGWKNTRLADAGNWALVSVLAADIACVLTLS